MKDYPSYSVCGIPAKNKLLGRFLNHFYKLYTEEKDINGTRYIVEYHRSPFWGYEEPTLKLFIKDKLLTWHGQVWEVFPGGSRCGFGTTCFTALFPKKRMKRFLDTESRFVWNACNKNEDCIGGQNVDNGRSR